MKGHNFTNMKKLILTDIGQINWLPVWNKLHNDLNSQAKVCKVMSVTKVMKHKDIFDKFLINKFKVTVRCVLLGFSLILWCLDFKNVELWGLLIRVYKTSNKNLFLKNIKNLFLFLWDSIYGIWANSYQVKGLSWVMGSWPK